ncbi:MAG TPA: DUF2189 domain-containing protein, partial [Hyphomicrobiales bacterium]|nr:DUF2189 domain-containing protein [Hyphomicrobiales bacterium]
MAGYVQSPLEWGWSELKQESLAFGSAAHAVAGSEGARRPEAITVRRIGTGDLTKALGQGFDDFAACRTDVIMLCLIYPLIGLILAAAAVGHAALPLVFPLVSGFALLGPVAAVGLYQMSRRREEGRGISWADAFGVLQSPALGAIGVLGLLLVAIFCAWIGAAYGIYAATLGPAPPASLATFAHDVVATPAGWAMIAAGIGAGFVFAAAVLAISVVSFPLLLDRDVGLASAIATSVRAVAANPGAMALWGLMVAAALVAGSIPFLLGLAVVVPAFGHATWHLYR